MKKSSTLLIVAAMLLTACGTATRLASSDSGQQFSDGIYSNTPAFRTRGAKEESKSETQALVEKTKESPIYLFGDRKDTVMIPQNMSATIKYDQKLGGTVVTVEDNPYEWRYDLENNYGYYYGPYSIGGSWHWSRYYTPWYSWSYSPWRHYGWYDPWYYGSYYDPWYYGGWYDPWYYSGWYDPWYYHHHHHHYYGHHHHPPHHGPGYMPDRPEHRNDRWYGNRRSTGSDRVFTSSTSLRGGGGRSTISRNATIASGTSARAEKVTANRSSVVRSAPAVRSKATAPSRVSGTVTAARPAATSVNRVTSSARRPSATTSGTVSSRPAGSSAATAGRTSVQSGYRRPSAAAGGTISGGGSRQVSGTATAGRGSSSGSRQSYSSGSSSGSSSSSYSRSSSSSSSRSSYSSGSSSSSRSSYSSGSGSSSRSSGGSGGGYSRSGGSSRR